MPGEPGMHTNLMGAPGNRTGFDQSGKLAEAPHHAKHRERFFTFGIDLDHALAGTQIVLQQRSTDLFLRGRPTTAHQRQIALINTITAQRLMQMPQHAALLGNHQQTRGIAIQTMDQFDILGIRTQLAERFDHTVIEATAAVHGDTRRFVQHDQRLIFVDDGCFEALQQPLRQRRRLVPLSQPQRRHAHHIASL